MPEKAVTFGVVYNRERGEGVGLAPRDGITEAVLTGVVGVGAPDGAGVLFFLNAGLGLPATGLFCVEVVDVSAIIVGAAGAFEFHAALGDIAWVVVNLALGTSLSLTNGGSLAIELAVRLVLGGPLVAFAAIRLNGAALALLGAGPFTARIVVRFREFNAGAMVSHERAIAFHDSPIDVENIPATLVQLERLFGFVGARAQIGTSASVPEARNFVTECSVAKPHPCAVVWVGPTDIGNLPEQIPADLASNNAAHYNYHPSSFFREPQYVRVVQVEPTMPWRTIPDPQLELSVSAPITTPNGALTIFQVTRPPTHSKWILTVDSVELEVILAHPVGSDLRKPVDIYTAVIAPAVRANNATGRALATFTRDFLDPTGFRQIGLENKMQFLDHALFVEPLDRSQLPITEVFYQQGAIVPPAPP